MKLNLSKVMMFYLVIFATLMLIYCSLNAPETIGEWDDYSLPVVSVMNDHNFSINEGDIIVFKQTYPLWANYIDSHSLSGYITRDGKGEMTWYFPIYSLACIPCTMLLKVLHLPLEYAFAYTNLFVLMIALILLFKYLNCDIKNRSLLVLLLSVNPIVFYIGWVSAEVFIYSALILGLMSWYNGWNKRAAVAVSIAGMLNPTILSIGLVMIAEYLTVVVKEKRPDEKWALFIKQNIGKVVRYGCCYSIGLIPMVYNYYNIGHINLTASLSGFSQGTESVGQRFFAYFFDLNYGFLPYYSILMILSVGFLILAIWKKNIRYCVWILTFIINVLLYSIMVHINCGMSGISRYNAWGALLLIFAVVLLDSKIKREELFKKVKNGLLCCGAFLTAILIFVYNPYLAKNAEYVYFTPLAEWVLEHVPSVYQPLYSTFNSRSNHVDGGYQYDLPIVYEGSDGYVRKILATKKEKAQLLEQYTSYAGKDVWFEQQLNTLKDTPTYISISGKNKIADIPVYQSESVLYFTKDVYNADAYVVRGLNKTEDWGTWTQGKTVVLRFKTDTDQENLHANLACTVYNASQAVQIFVNDVNVYDNPNYTGEEINFDFANPGNQEIVEMRIELPRAISPKQLGYPDNRVLGLGLYQMSIW